MCGFVVSIGIDRPEALKKGLSSIRYRGPDALGLWNSRDGEFPINMGHVRLSILDLDSSANQPFQSEDGRYVFVFNGEIYNFLELKCDLECAGHQFKTESDTEVFMQGLISYGPEFQKKCNGMWAFCLWDRLTSSALIGRDRFGIKPLYFTEIGSQKSTRSIVLASEMKALFPFMDSISPSKQINYCIENLFSYESTSVCVVEGISRIEPGNTMYWKEHKVIINQWWSSLDHLSTAPVKYDDQVEVWKNLFLDSVSLRMRSDVSIGSALSGGLDSSSIYSAMHHISVDANNSSSRHPNHSKDGFCSHFPGSSNDELHWASLVASYCGSNINSITINPLASGWSLQDALYQVEDPYLTLPFPMLATYRAIKSSGISVTLDGHGADELLSGYGHWNKILEAPILRSEYMEIMAIDESTKTGVYSVNEKKHLKRWTRKCIKKWLVKNNLMPFKGVLNRGQANSECLSEYEKKLSDLHQRQIYQEMDVFNQVLFEIFHLSILPTLLRNYDRYSMASGVEVRMPFMDWRLVCFAFSLPWRSKVGNTFTKRIHRDAMRSMLPEAVRCRRDKLGWNSPMHEWLTGPLKPQINQMLSDSKDTDSKLLCDWNHFLLSPHLTYKDGEAMWTKILPVAWKQSIF